MLWRQTAWVDPSAPLRDHCYQHVSARYPLVVSHEAICLTLALATTLKAHFIGLYYSIVLPTSAAQNVIRAFILARALIIPSDLLDFRRARPAHLAVLSTYV